jgi:predicted DNA binding protein
MGCAVKMEMTIKQLANELGVSKTTISKVVSGLGFNGKLHKVGNRYMLSETQISQIKSQISQFSQTNEGEKSQISQTNEQEKIQISLLEKQNAILQEQLSILNKQLSVKDEQIKLLQEQLIAKDVQIGQVTTAMESMATALTAEQALHAGTIRKQLTEYSTIESSSDETEQPKQKQGLFLRLFGRKNQDKEI